MNNRINATYQLAPMSRKLHKCPTGTHGDRPTPYNSLSKKQSIPATLLLQIHLLILTCRRGAVKLFEQTHEDLCPLFIIHININTHVTPSQNQPMCFQKADMSLVFGERIFPLVAPCRTMSVLGQQENSEGRRTYPYQQNHHNSTSPPSPTHPHQQQTINTTTQPHTTNTPPSLPPYLVDPKF
jgi:hypothetical protein